MAGRGLLLMAIAALVIDIVRLEVRMVEEPYHVSVHGQTYRGDAWWVGRFARGLGRLA